MDLVSGLGKVAGILKAAMNLWVTQNTELLG